MPGNAIRAGAEAVPSCDNQDTPERIICQTSPSQPAFNKKLSITDKCIGDECKLPIPDSFETFLEPPDARPNAAAGVSCQQQRAQEFSSAETETHRWRLRLRNATA